MYLDLIPQILPISIPFIFTILILRFLLIIRINELTWKNSKKERTKKTSKKTNNFFLSLFISFDPKTNILTEINWIVLILVTTIFFVRIWKKPRRINIILFKLNEQIGEQFKIALKSNKDRRKGIFVSLFLLILSVNIIGLFPNIFTPTSHISINLVLSLPIWLGFLIFGWVNFTNKIFRHLVPSGTPTPLIRFIVLIELIRNFIRPLTLRIRLIANIVSGHLLLTLIGNLIERRSIIIIIILTLVQRVLTTLELGVAFIQAYVFCILLTLYSDDSDLRDH